MPYSLVPEKTHAEGVRKMSFCTEARDVIKKRRAEQE